MKILFIQKDVFAKPAVMALSALLKKEDHDIRLLIDDLEKECDAKITADLPDLICFSITTGEYPWMKKTGQRIRQFYSGLIICGGPHPTFYPELIHDDYLDAICIGEGDQAFIEFTAILEKGGDISGVENFFIKKEGQLFKNNVRHLVSDLDGLPFYDREIYKDYKLYDAPHNDILYHNVVITGRGCPYKCSFCFNKAYNDLYLGRGRIVRRRSVDNVMNELRVLKKNQNPDFITFDDDTFTLASGKWMDEFFSKYSREIGIPFKLNARTTHINENLVKKLKKAGCFAVKLGLESGNETIRNVLLQKNISQKSIIQAAYLLKKYRIRFQTFNMIGNPGETLDMAFETYNLNKKIKPDFVWCSLLTPYPGTGIFQYALKNNYLKKNFDHDAASYSYFDDTPILMKDRKKMRNLQKLLFFGVYFQLSEKMMRILSGLPFSFLYNMIFGVGVFAGLVKINKIKFATSFKITIKHLMKYNFEAKKK